jgi:uncharacterized LabA/DUF88 family protein
VILIEPTTKRAVAFVDGQNLYHAARKAFGYSYPNYDVQALASAVCRTKGWGLAQVRFYTGLADASRDPFWYNFWTAKLAVMGRQGVKVFTRSVRYRRRIVRLPDGTEQDIPVAEEKGIDVRIALDVILMALRSEYDVGVIFSQDQDLSEVATDVPIIAQQQGRWIKLACAYPVGPGSHNLRGVNSTDWIEIDAVTYNDCLDRRDYLRRLRLRGLDAPHQWWEE